MPSYDSRSPENIPLPNPHEGDQTLRKARSVMGNAVLSKIEGTDVVLVPRIVRGIKLGNGSSLRKYIAETKVEDMLDPPE